MFVFLQEKYIFRKYYAYARVLTIFWQKRDDEFIIWYRDNILNNLIYSSYIEKLFLLRLTNIFLHSWNFKYILLIAKTGISS